jgi:hypothetical protein
VVGAIDKLPCDGLAQLPEEPVAKGQQLEAGAAGICVAKLGEVSGGPVVTQSDIAPTILRIFGLQAALLDNTAGKPLEAIAGGR